MKKTIFAIIATLFLSFSSYAGDGFNWDTGSFFDVESFDHRGTGEGDVEYFDYGTSQYKYGYLDMESGGSGTLYDYDTGEWYWVEMD